MNNYLYCCILIKKTFNKKHLIGVFKYSLKGYKYFSRQVLTKI